MNNFSEDDLKAIKNDLLMNSEKDQINDANNIALILSEDSDDKEDLYLSILSHYSKKENKQELNALIAKLANLDIK